MEATVSAPWMWEMSKHSMRVGGSARVSASCRASCDGVLGGGLEDAETLVVGLLGVLADEVDEGAFVAALGGGDFDFVASERFAEFRSARSCAVGEVYGDVDAAGDVGLWSR